jgi:hypothetical protein
MANLEDPTLYYILYIYIYIIYIYTYVCMYVSMYVFVPSPTKYISIPHPETPGAAGHRQFQAFR